MSTSSVTNPSSEKSETSPATQIADLSSRLQERDKLVDILTQRLEAAAEQLDRIRRTGGDRGGASQGGGGLSREMVQQQQSITEKLEAAVDEWQEAQPQEALVRIEDRLDQIMQMVSNGSFVAKSGSGSFGGSAASRHNAMKDVSTPPVKNASSSAPSSGVSGLSSWEAMKAELMGEAPPKPAVLNDEQEADNENESVQASTPAVSEDEIIAGPLPVIIDVDQASLEELKEAVTSRDTYISTLLRQFRVVSGRQPIDWKAVKELAPTELQAVFQNFEKRLKEELQREELDISLERAKVARERGQLDQIRTRLEREIRKINVQPGQEPPAEEAESNTPAAANASTSGGRWKGILGLGKGKK